MCAPHVAAETFILREHRYPGDPAKAARAVALALESDTTPLRLQLGGDSIAAVRAHAEQLLKDLNQWERVGAETAVDAAAA